MCLQGAEAAFRQPRHRLPRCTARRLPPAACSTLQSCRRHHPRSQRPAVPAAAPQRRFLDPRRPAWSGGQVRSLLLQPQPHQSRHTELRAPIRRFVLQFRLPHPMHRWPARDNRGCTAAVRRPRCCTCCTCFRCLCLSLARYLRCWSRRLPPSLLPACGLDQPPVFRKTTRAQGAQPPLSIFISQATPAPCPNALAPHPKKPPQPQTRWSLTRRRSQRGLSPSSPRYIACRAAREQEAERRVRDDEDRMRDQLTRYVVQLPRAICRMAELTSL